MPNSLLLDQTLFSTQKEPKMIATIGNRVLAIVKERLTFTKYVQQSK